MDERLSRLDEYTLLSIPELAFLVGGVEVEGASMIEALGLTASLKVAEYVRLGRELFEFRLQSLENEEDADWLRDYLLAVSEAVKGARQIYKTQTMGEEGVKLVILVGPTSAVELVLGFDGWLGVRLADVSDVVGRVLGVGGNPRPGLGLIVECSGRDHLGGGLAWDGQDHLLSRDESGLWQDVEVWNLSTIETKFAVQVELWMTERGS